MVGGPLPQIFCSRHLVLKKGERLQIGTQTGTFKPIYLLPLSWIISHSMDCQTALDEDEAVPRADFTSDPFTARREPLRDLINTFSDIY